MHGGKTNIQTSRNTTAARLPARSVRLHLASMRYNPAIRLEEAV
jgi:hypothetical protein